MHSHLLGGRGEATSRRFAFEARGSGSGWPGPGSSLGSRPLVVRAPCGWASSGKGSLARVVGVGALRVWWLRCVAWFARAWCVAVGFVGVAGRQQVGFVVGHNLSHPLGDLGAPLGFDRFEGVIAQGQGGG